MSEKTPSRPTRRRGALLLRAGLLLALLSLATPALATHEALQFTFNDGARASIYSADYVLDNWTRWEGETCWLEIPDYGRVELLLPAEIGGDAEIERFYPHNPLHVADALDALTHRASLADLKIYVLPFPRVGITGSSAAGHRVFLSPGVNPIPEEVTHMVTAHELGHVFHNTYMPDDDVAVWRRYRDLRDIEDATVYCAEAAHRNRPHEILAEDYRYLFGGPLANYSTSIENSSLPLPDLVTGLPEFLAALGTPVDKPTVAGALAASNYPNPFNPTTRIELSAADEQLGSALSVEVFDAAGRLVRTLHRGVLERRQVSFQWDGKDDQGLTVSTGFYFARIRVGAQRLSRKMLLLG